jgi:hypothetical protein
MILFLLLFWTVSSKLLIYSQHILNAAFLI